MADRSVGRAMDEALEGLLSMQENVTAALVAHGASVTVGSAQPVRIRQGWVRIPHAPQHGGATGLASGS